MKWQAEIPRKAVILRPTGGRPDATRVGAPGGTGGAGSPPLECGYCPQVTFLQRVGLMRPARSRPTYCGTAAHMAFDALVLGVRMVAAVCKIQIFK